MAPVAGVTTDVSSAHMAEIEIPILGLNVQALAPPEAWATIWRGTGPGFKKNWQLLMGKTGEKLMISMIFDGLPKEKWDFTCQEKGEIIDRW